MNGVTSGVVAYCKGKPMALGLTSTCLSRLLSQ